MAIFSALLSMLSRKIGSLLRAIFGWAITGLFGRLPSGKQTALSAALLLSIAWPLLVVGVFAPHVAAWAVAFMPLHDWAPQWVLRLVWLGLALAVPLIVGAVVRWVTPSEARKGGAARGLLSGYPLTLGFAISFLITLFVVPVLKLAALARRWSDEHVYCQVQKGAYANVVGEVHDALERGGIHTSVQRPPRAMLAATQVIKWFARGGLDPIVPDEPKMLRGDALQVYLYPGDLVLRGTKIDVARSRAVLLRELMHADAWLTEDPKAQHIEEQIHRLWAVVEKHDGPAELGATASMRIREIAREVEHGAFSVQDWTLLTLNLHRLEKAVAGGPTLVEGATETGRANLEREEESRHTKTQTQASRTAVVARHEVTMMQSDPRPEASTADLVREALDEAKQLVKIEVELAKEEVRQELVDAKRAAIMFGVAAVAALLAAAMMFVALALAIFPGPVPALVIGVVLVAAAAILGFVGFKKVPKKPLERTRRRVETDAQVIKEGVA